MKGNDKVIEELNDELADELTAVSQYMVHSSMCENWGYGKLHQVIEKRAIDEMKHAEKLIERILFLEGTPVVTKLNKMVIGSNVEDQLKNDKISEIGAIKAYNTSVRLATDQGDYGTAELFKCNLKDEEAHLDWLEAQLDQIDQMGIQNYLVEKVA
ncbi:MAG TPA: bacterioferritin [Anaerolineaceae bacterium]|nr:bacterioferritin [Anaerolineaceae bacterium]